MSYEPTTLQCPKCEELRANPRAEHPRGEDGSIVEFRRIVSVCESRLCSRCETDMRTSAATVNQSPVTGFVVGSDEPITRSVSVMARHEDGTATVVYERIVRGSPIRRRGRIQ